MDRARTTLVDGALAASPVAVIYFSGWAYITSYIGQFGIDATQIDITFPVVLVYSFIPLKSICTITIAAIMLLLMSMPYILENNKIVRDVNFRWIALICYMITTALAIILLFAIKASANAAAHAMADQVWAGNKAQSEVPLRETLNGILPYRMYQSCQNGGRLRQIVGLRDQLFLLCRSQYDPCNRGTLFSVSSRGHILYFAPKVRRDINEHEICNH